MSRSLLNTPRRGFFTSCQSRVLRPSSYPAQRCSCIALTSGSKPILRETLRPLQSYITTHSGTRMEMSSIASMSANTAASDLAVSTVQDSGNSQVAFDGTSLSLKSNIVQVACNLPTIGIDLHRAAGLQGEWRIRSRPSEIRPQCSR